jgi:hypothetical protein
LIWMEFTKTSHMAPEANLIGAPQDKFVGFPEAKSDRSPEYYFDRASKNRPILSSIPVVVADAEKLARQAVTSATRAERTVQVLFGTGVLAIAAAVVGLFSLLAGENSNVLATRSLIRDVSVQAAQAASAAARAEDDTKALRAQIETADLARVGDELRRSRIRLDEAMAQIEALKLEVGSLRK